MRFIAIVFMVLLLTVPALGGEREVEMKSKYPDFTPHDGIMDPGSRMNPYIITDGNKTYEVRSKYPDIKPGDGIMDAGSPQNPYVMEQKD